ncbi:hypothetical protein C7I87_28180 [Mesorhizobium sp. SARCC-RB16n]|nr:hypothetical protein C7I87_28180 [Mesorhizobium sp. SARCC-RB16n]
MIEAGDTSEIGTPQNGLDAPQNEPIDHRGNLARTVAEYDTTPEERDFLDFVAAQFDPETYLEINSDVAAAGLDPARHWLDHGLKEGRRISPFVDVCCGDVATSFFCRKWTHYRWRGMVVAVRTASPIPQEIVKQIVNQARYDAGVLAPGENAIPNLRKFYAFDFASRDSLDVDGLLVSIPRPPDVLLIADRLGPDPVGEFVANLVDGLSGAGRSTQVIATEQISSELDAINDPLLLARLRKASILCWLDFVRDGRGASYLWDISRDATSGANLALLVNGLRPKAVVVLTGQMGLDMLRRFGRGLSQNSPLYRVQLGSPHDRFGATRTDDRSGETPRFATFVTDNARAEVILRDHLLGPSS